MKNAIKKIEMLIENEIKTPPKNEWNYGIMSDLTKEELRDLQRPDFRMEQVKSALPTSLKMGAVSGAIGLATGHPETALPGLAIATGLPIGKYFAAKNLQKLGQQAMETDRAKYDQANFEYLKSLPQSKGKTDEELRNEYELLKNTQLRNMGVYK